MKGLSFIKKNWQAISVLLLTVITCLSLWPLQNLPDIPGTDKTHHLIAYAVLMFPAALQMPRHWQGIGLFYFAWSGAIELVQPYVNRYGEWLDLAVNGAGLLCGLLIALLIGRLAGFENGVTRGVRAD